VAEDRYVRFEVLTAVVMKITVFWDCLPPAFKLIICLVYSILKKEAVSSSETSI
jgi:hypothetical protein